MDTRTLKRYAPEARKKFIDAVKTKAEMYGLTKGNITPIRENGDTIIIGNSIFPSSVTKQRRKLELRIKNEGFDSMIESIAYTWFNRFVAIRYMELHDFLPYGYRVLSHTNKEKQLPEILEYADQIDLFGLDRSEVIEMKLAGNQDDLLYQKILLAQCHSLHEKMPFLFERVTDETELLLPGNLLQTESLIRGLVNEIVEKLWENVEIIGWLYQFYISEKKDEVIGKTVASKDIPAATQLFTPNWIVKYLVQNTLGKQWIKMYPNSKLRNKMEYYIPSENVGAACPNHPCPSEGGEIKQVEELTFLDPACGSGHILVEAYNLFREIYLECGYRKQEIPELILSKNLFGIEIDDRAAQLASFALLMKAAEDNKTILKNSKNIIPNIVTIKESNTIDIEMITQHIAEQQAKIDTIPLPKKKFAIIEQEEKPLLATNPKRSLIQETGLLDMVTDLIDLFKDAKTFGSLIRIPETLILQLDKIKDRVKIIDQHGNLYEKEVAESLKPFVKQTEMLAKQYDFVVTNPPYMGNKFLNPTLKKFATENYPDTKTDLFAMFIERGLELVKEKGICGMVTMQSWMFLSSFENIRLQLLEKHPILAMTHMANIVMGIAFGTASTIWQKNGDSKVKGNFCYIEFEDIGKDNKPVSFPPQNSRNQSIPKGQNFFRASADDFKKIPGSPIAYWVSEKIQKIFENSQPLGEIAAPCHGMSTCDNNRFLRQWYEIPFEKIKFNVTTHEEVKKSQKKWFPYNKGGDFRKWFGNQDYLVNWENDGEELRNFKDEKGRLRCRLLNLDCIYEKSISWSLITSGVPAFRFFPNGFLFDAVGSSIFIDDEIMRQKILGFCNSKIAINILNILNPTLALPMGSIASLPLIPDVECPGINRLIDLSQQDWDSYETSWNFTENPLVRLSREMESEE
jgi:hypothetical protein